jgi:hypothetical protein
VLTFDEMEGNHD